LWKISKKGCFFSEEMAGSFHMIKNIKKLIPIAPPSQAKVRKYLSADSLIKMVRNQFKQISDYRKGNTMISLCDALMSAFAMFFLKDPSLLAFDERRKEEDHNLKNIFGIEQIPCDSQMREIIDNVPSESFRPAFLAVFRRLQRGKALESMIFMKGCYLLSIDGTGYFSSHKLTSEACMVKVSKKTGKKTYYIQALAACLVHPDRKEVIPLCPEIIQKQDGDTKNDCERNAAKRFLGKFRKDHPHLKIIVIEDGLSSNTPHIKEIKAHNMHFILGVKPGDHEFLFKHIGRAVDEGKAVEFSCVDEDNSKKEHYFRFVNEVPLNGSNKDMLVNFLEYWQIEGDEIKHFSWVTDFQITLENAYQLMRGGRARWKVENETFNTLKNQGYHFEHNYGLGTKHLSTNLILLMMLVFLLDQTQQLSCNLFQSVWKKLGSKRSLWEQMRGMFKNFKLESMEMLFQALLYGYKKQTPVIYLNSS
jgi:hypothetical protein